MMDFEMLDNITSIIGDDDAKEALFDSSDNVIEKLEGKYDWLSSLHVVPQNSMVFWSEGDSIKSNRVNFKSLEHAFQARKTFNREQQLAIINAKTSKQARRLGSKVDLIDDWEDKQVEIMENLIEEKFCQNFHLKLKLLATGKSKIINSINSGDEFWGVTSNGGMNKLGVLLMKVRDRISKDEGDALVALNHFFDKNNLSFVKDWVDPTKVQF